MLNVSPLPGRVCHLFSKGTYCMYVLSPAGVKNTSKDANTLSPVTQYLHDNVKN